MNLSLTSTTHFKDKVVVITGGTSGIGRALVELFLQLNAKVVTCGQNYDRIYQLQSLYVGYPLHINLVDVSKHNDCAQFINDAIKSFGQIDILINNAGIKSNSSLQEISIPAFQKVMDVNFNSMLYCTKLASPHLIKTKGIIVGINEDVKTSTIANNIAYWSSKFAMNGFLLSLQHELAPHNVAVLELVPTVPIHTNIHYRVMNAIGEIIAVDEKKDNRTRKKMLYPDWIAKKIIEILIKVPKRKKGLLDRKTLTIKI
ncbi:MAG: SDR family NAD(P)-dependent oxidoreductase [Phycisphaerales bacterium]|nr:SDR family NAD(P)-dependent oxidoreductase [Phycisphaerales bacterium]